MASTNGFKNLDRVLSYLMPACVKYGEDYTVLHDMYRQVINQRMLELNHVAKLVGGVYDTALALPVLAELAGPLGLSANPGSSAG